jgi:hypothetical protein
MARYSNEATSDEQFRKRLGPELLKRFERDLRSAGQTGDSEQIKMTFRKYYLQPQNEQTTVALVLKYCELRPEVVGHDEFLQKEVLSIPGLREAVTARSAYLAPMEAPVSEQRRMETTVASSPKLKNPLASKQPDPEVAKRRTLVKSNRDSTATDLCGIFDQARVPLPWKWQDVGFDSWSKAYRDPNYRERIDVLISKDRRNS